MHTLLTEAVRYYHQHGLRQLLGRGLQYCYDTAIRPSLPRVTSMYNSVEVRVHRLGDAVVPWYQPAKPGYESALVDGLTTHVQGGDHVVIVGGGRGVTATVAARHVGETGHVTVYEGSQQMLAQIRQTLSRNGVADRVTVRHGVVGDNVHVYNSETAPLVSAADLPACDVLELDCEGAETTILPEFECCPRAILVETHGQFDAPPDRVAAMLADRSYAVVDRALADASQAEACVENDIYVLTALRDAEK